MNEMHHRLAAVPSDLLYIQYTAAERHRRLADDARRIRLRRWSRG